MISKSQWVFLQLIEKKIKGLFHPLAFMEIHKSQRHFLVNYSTKILTEIDR